MTERPVELDSLMLFHEVIAAGSLTAASAKLNMAKSTVSRRLTRLERQFGSILLKKSARKLTLTEVGARLHKRCQKIAAEVHQATQEALTVHQGLTGTLRVTVPGDIGVTWLGRVLAEFARRFPDITVAIRIHNSEVIDLMKEPFDVAIEVGETRPSQLVCKRLATLSRGIYASPQYLALRGTPSSLDECRAHDWIVTEVQERDGVRLFRERSRRRVIAVTHKIVANSARLVRELAIAGLGLALIPDVLCVEAQKEGRLVRVLVPWQSPPVQLTALFLSRDRIQKKTRIFLDFFAEQVRYSQH